MRIAVVGGGPAGLYFAMLARQRLPHVEVTVYEQNPEGATYGFGVVLADRGLNRLRAADPVTCREIVEASFVSRHRKISHRGETIFIEGGGYGGAIGRQRLLDILQRGCERVGVELVYESRIPNGDALDANLIVGADGVNSVIRSANPDDFRATDVPLTNKLAWYGTAHHFPYPILAFKSARGGWFWGVGYAYADNMGTFVAECDAETWSKCGLDKMTDDERKALTESIFAEELGGKELISNRSIWGSLRVVRSQNWWSGRCVLIGDALHNANPTIGSGTRIAMEDAIALVEALAPEGPLENALASFQKARSPARQKLLEATDRSIQWYENLAPRLDKLDALRLVFEFMRRTGRIDEARLAAEYPRFVERYGAQLRSLDTQAVGRLA